VPWHAAPSPESLLSMLCHVEQLGLIDYAEALQLQQELVAQRKAKLAPDTLLLLEHPHVYTLGRNASREHLLFSEEKLRSLNALVC
jgi:lipoyl(octanoyl) transferase